MKASELIAQLQTLVAEHGDLEVLTPEGEHFDLDTVNHAVFGPAQGYAFHPFATLARVDVFVLSQSPWHMR